MSVFTNNPVMSNTFTSNGVSQIISGLPSDLVKFEMYDLTYFGSAAASTTEEIAWWVNGLAAGSAYVGNKTNAAATIAITSMITTNGFTFFNPSTTSVLSNAVAITGVSQAAPAVASTGSTLGLNNGDTVRIYGTTAMLQISGYDFTIGGIIANTSFTLAYLNSSAFAAAATAGFWRRVNVPAPYYPAARLITAVGLSATGTVPANATRITLSVNHGYTVGQMVRLYCSAQFGTSQLNGQLAMISAVGNADASGFTNTIDVLINSAAYTAFAFPTSGQAAAGDLLPQVVPVGENAINSATYPFGNSLQDATVNQSRCSMTLGSSVVGANGDQILWIAYRGMSF